MATNSAERVKDVHHDHNRRDTGGLVRREVRLYSSMKKINTITLPMRTKSIIAMWNTIITRK